MFEYHCRRVSNSAIISWDDMEAIYLVQTLDGLRPRLKTAVRSCYDNDCLYIRYECEDDRIVATMNERDAPLYKEDVVEAFIDAEGSGKHYYEFELSPLNALFDAEIVMREDESFELKTEWNANGIRTTADHPSTPFGQQYVYEMAIPFTNFGQTPHPGDRWRINYYRIDEDRDGKRHYWAWSPTGKINFHRPAFFGKLIFD